MESIRKAIRGALEKGDAQNRAFREKVYRQAFAALERSLQAKPELSVEDIRQRREQVKAIIVDIESEFIPAVAPAAPRRPASEPVPETDVMPRVERGDRPSSIARSESEFAAHGERRTPVAETAGRRAPLAMLILLAVLIAVVGIGAWWMLTPQTPQEGDASGAAPSLAGEEASDAGQARTDGGVEAGGDWITIFSPDDPTTVRAPAVASAEVVDGEETAFLRIGADAPGIAVSFDVGQGILEQLAGRSVIFSLTARADQAPETQISITCDFGALGGCGRKRYMVGATASEYLFEVEMPDTNPDSGGSIAIVPDIEGRGRMLDILSLRVATAN